MALWRWVLADPSGRGLAAVAGSGRSVEFTRNSFAEARTTISHDDEAASVLFDALEVGVPQLLCYRAGELRFRGWLDSTDEEAGEASTLTLVFRSPFAVLLGDGANVGRFTPSESSFAQVDQGQIAFDLLQWVNHEAPTGLVPGVLQESVKRDRNYDPNKNVGQAIQQLTDVIGGFDFEERFVEPREDDALAEMDVYAKLGADRPEARFEYGAGTLRNVRRVGRKLTRPINEVRVEGQNGVPVVASNASSAARYVKRTKVVSAADVSDTATMTEKANAALRPSWVRVIDFDPETATAPQPWDDYWLGDTVRFNARRGGLVESQKPVLNALKITVGENGDETAHTLSIQQEGD